jgi:hypothetical protein
MWPVYAHRAFAANGGLTAVNALGTLAGPIRWIVTVERSEHRVDGLDTHSLTGGLLRSALPKGQYRAATAIETGVADQLPSPPPSSASPSSSCGGVRPV